MKDNEILKIADEGVSEGMFGWIAPLFKKSTKDMDQNLIEEKQRLEARLAEIKTTLEDKAMLQFYIPKYAKRLQQLNFQELRMLVIDLYKHNQVLEDNLNSWRQSKLKSSGG